MVVSRPSTSSTQRNPCRNIPAFVAGGGSVKVTVCPATVTVPTRGLGPAGLAVRLNVTEPLPVVPAAPLTVAQDTLELDVQAQPEVVLTAIAIMPPDHAKCAGGVTV